MDKRTLTQNKAFHLYFKMLADELNSAGLDAKRVLKPEIDIPWTPDMIKRHLWKAVQDAMFEKDSTTKLTTKEVGEVYEVLNRHLGEKFSIHVPFPSEENA
ncbi:hypothetical protein HN682_07985 [Candidatus Peregrinibacteria bacterium]|jgi:hypothetical protein|nr:hypothetical protein [Candidatus Peregrinibacteria bacterium]